MRNMRKRCHNIYQFGEIKIERLIKKEEDGGGKKRERKKEGKMKERVRECFTRLDSYNRSAENCMTKQ